MNVQLLRKQKKFILKSGISRIIHVIAKNIGTDLPVIGVRLSKYPEKVKVYRHVKILGPSILIHDPNNPIPGTDGRAVCVLRTKAKLIVYKDSYVC